MLSALLAGVSALIMSLVKTRSRGEGGTGHGTMQWMWDLGDGFTYIFKNKTIAMFMALVALHCALVMSFESILPVFSRESLGAADGSILGYLGDGFRSRFPCRNTHFGGRSQRETQGAASGLDRTGERLGAHYSRAVIQRANGRIGKRRMGLSQATFMALTSAYVQTIAPDRLRGRISSLYILFAGGIMAFANLGYGFAADEFSAPPILLITGVIFIAVVLALTAGQPILRSIYRTGQAATRNSLIGAVTE